MVKQVLFQSDGWFTTLNHICTLRLEPQVIFIKEAGKKAVHNNCIQVPF
jgi:hypothetical protein